jgi:hypothetical protein
MRASHLCFAIIAVSLFLIPPTANANCNGCTAAQTGECNRQRDFLENECRRFNCHGACTLEAHLDCKKRGEEAWDACETRMMLQNSRVTNPKPKGVNPNHASPPPKSN